MCKNHFMIRYIIDKQTRRRIDCSTDIITKDVINKTKRRGLYSCWLGNPGEKPFGNNRLKIIIKMSVSRNFQQINIEISTNK